MLPLQLPLCSSDSDSGLAGLKALLVMVATTLSTSRDGATADQRIVRLSLPLDGSPFASLPSLSASHRPIRLVALTISNWTVFLSVN